MASRRKSARPTNKLRQHQMEMEEDEEEDTSDKRVLGVSVSGAIKQREVIHASTPLASQTGRLTPILELSVTPEHHHPVPCISEPHIALPSDIYRDFQTLKSVTKLDTTELMRRLLKDYHTTSTGLPQREQRLDSTTADIFIPRSSNALDLSKPKGTTLVSYGYQQGSSTQLNAGSRFTDDQLAMRTAVKDEHRDDKFDATPLDLTLQKQKDEHFPAESVHEESARSQAQTYRYFTNLSEEDTQSFKRAGSYVINLEPSGEISQFANSSLARALQMDLPLHNFKKLKTPASERPEKHVIQKEEFLPPNQRKTITEINTLCQSSVPSRSKLFHQETVLPTTQSSQTQEVTNVNSGLSGLPSYAEAVTSVLNSQQRLSLNKKAVLDKSNESLVHEQNVNKTVQEFPPGSLQFLHVGPENSDIKFIPFSITPQQFPTTTSSQEQHKQQQNLLQNLLLHQLQSEYKTMQQNFHQPPVNVFSSDQTSNAQEAEPELSDAQKTPQDAKSTDMPYPNFLMDSQAVGISSISTAVSNVTMAPNTIPTATVPMPTFFMAASTNGGMSHMVAIPVIHALPDGVTGVQSFAFAPHPIPQSTSTPTATTRHSPAALIATQEALSTGDPNSLKQGDLSQDSTATLSRFTLEANDTTATGAAKPKPGRPRGRGGRGQAQKTQNKGMKLLTENTLFPGVYTSILKLPWSRRSRNKTKTKTISEMKKQAQIIAHDKLNEDENPFPSEGDRREKEITEHQKPVKVSLDHSVLPTTVDQPVEVLQVQQEQRDNERQQQIEQQKQKDLEQQQRLHMQYHLRLREEQRKLAKQIEQSYLMNSDSSTSLSLTVPLRAMLSEKGDSLKPDTIQREDSNLIESTSFNVPAESFLHGNQQLLSKESSSVMISNPDNCASKNVPRKRGRPPKVAHLPSKVSNQSSFSTAPVSSVLDQYEPDNFLHANVSDHSFELALSESKLRSAAAIFPRHISLAEEAHNLDSAPTSAVEEMQVDSSNEMSFDKKINFLANQISLEMTKNLAINQVLLSGKMTTQSDKCDDENGNIEDTMFHKAKTDNSKSLVDVKPRRKKVSRLLKSDENFMYATFKIKPKGLTPRKSRRRRKDVLAGASTADGTAGNMGQPQFQESSASTLDNSRALSMVAWKFHEQYPCQNEEEDDEEEAEDIKDRTQICITCGQSIIYENEDPTSQYCQACLSGNSEIPTPEEQNNNFSLISGDKIGLPQAELKTVCCVTCGNVFQKLFSDSSARCNVCITSARGIIRSSRLFTFHDSITEPASLEPAVPRLPISSSSYLSAPEISPPKEDKCSDKNLTKINNNHLYCSLCRMEFAKICDYLSHIRDKHETKLEKKVQFLGDIAGTNDASRKTRVSKTKKSLAHKTLTCPVEECPHFFREQRDLDIHFMKKHSNLGTCPHSGCSFSYSTSEQLDNHLRFEHSVAANTAGSGSGLCVTKDVAILDSDRAGLGGTASEKPLQCEFCEYRCRQKNALKWHMRKHPETASQYRKYSSLSGD